LALSDPARRWSGRTTVAKGEIDLEQLERVASHGRLGDGPDDSEADRSLVADPSSSRPSLPSHTGERS
jgi:hypothetical protein